MNRRILTLALVGLAAPAMPAAGQRAIDLSLHGIGVFSRRSAAFDGGTGLGSGRLTGGELRARARVWGATARWVGGAFEADSGSAAVGTIAEGEVDLNVGPRVFSGVLGYGRRSYTGAVGTRRWSLLRVGAETWLPLGTTGLHAQARAVRSFTVGGGDGGGNGTVIETRLGFTTRRFPLSFAIGYRASSFTAKSSTGARPDGVTGPLIAIGVRWP